MLSENELMAKYKFVPLSKQMCRKCCFKDCTKAHLGQLGIHVESLNSYLGDCEDGGYYIEKEERSNYVKRVWLNPSDSDSTGSVVAFNGTVSSEGTSGPVDWSFLEISDCKSKIRLHKTHDDTNSDFINKLKLLSSTINDFVEHLEKNSCQETK